MRKALRPSVAEAVAHFNERIQRARIFETHDDDRVNQNPKKQFRLVSAFDDGGQLHSVYFRVQEAGRIGKKGVYTVRDVEPPGTFRAEASGAKPSAINAANVGPTSVSMADLLGNLRYSDDSEIGLRSSSLNQFLLNRRARGLDEIRADRDQIVYDLKQSLSKGSLGSGAPENLPEVLKHVGRLVANLAVEGDAYLLFGIRDDQPDEGFRP